MDARCKSVPGSVPKDAYRFAKGEEVLASSGQRAKAFRVGPPPTAVQFLVVRNHRTHGIFPQLMSRATRADGNAKGRKWYYEINSGKGARGRCL